MLHRVHLPEVLYSAPPAASAFAPSEISGYDGRNRREWLGRYREAAGGEVVEGERAVLFDMRTYTCRPGTLQAHLGLYERQGLTVQKRHLGEPLLYAVTESGPLNTFVHIWAYEDAADRGRRRRAMEADPEWIAYRKQSAEAGYLISQENRLLTAANFFSLSNQRFG